MLSLTGLKRKIDSTEDLRSVVKTMKTLAAVNIRQFEKAVAALKIYSRTVEMGLQAALINRQGFTVTAQIVAEGSATGAIVFGTDQGMCGSLNEAIVAHALQAVAELKIEQGHLHLIAVGLRAGNRLEEEGRRVQETFSVPGSVEAIMPLVHNLVLEIDGWIERERVSRVYLFNCVPQPGAAYRPSQVRLLPVDRWWLRELREKPWPGNQQPWFSLDWDTLFSTLIRQYIFVTVHRAATESLAAENTSRLAAMQGAESSIEDRLDELQGQYLRRRQMGITEELLDIVSGFEALKTGGSGRK
jgi:F-type H+-transporting ATPase subunit gamma